MLNYSAPGHASPLLRSGAVVLVLRAQPGTRHRMGQMTCEPIFDHDRLDAYRLSIAYVAKSFAIAKDLSGAHRHARDQRLRAAQPIPLNIAEGNGAEGNGKRHTKDRRRFLDITRGSALECAAIQDVLAATNGLDDEPNLDLKRSLHRMVAMLTRLISRLNVVAEPETS